MISHDPARTPSLAKREKAMHRLFLAQGVQQSLERAIKDLPQPYRAVLASMANELRIIHDSLERVL